MNKKGLTTRQLEEHIVSILASMVKACSGSQKQRILSKFTENDHEKVRDDNPDMCAIFSVGQVNNIPIWDKFFTGISCHSWSNSFYIFYFSVNPNNVHYRLHLNMPN